MLYLFVLLGAVFILLRSLNKAFVKPEFEWSIFVRKNIVETLLNMIAGAIIILAFQLKEGMFHLGMFDFMRFFCVFLGISGQMVFNFLVQLTSKSYKTWFGINKK